MMIPILATLPILIADIPGVTPVPRDADWLKAHEKNVALAKAGGAPVVFLGGDITWHWTYPDNGKPVWDRYARLGAPKAVPPSPSTRRTPV